jgi:lipopolysaccharide/colanic/teichoic acid biosynthesis glycosyltransferase
MAEVIVLGTRMSLVGPRRVPERVIDRTSTAARYSTRVGVKYA